MVGRASRRDLDPQRRPVEEQRVKLRGMALIRAETRARVARRLTAVRLALRRAVPGDLVVMCVDDAVGVYREAMAAAGGRGDAMAFADPGELEVPEG